MAERGQSLSLPSDIVREAERLARQEGRTKTEVLREALRRYATEKRWRRLQRYGAGRARKAGMTTPTWGMPSGSSAAAVQLAIEESKR